MPNTRSRIMTALGLVVALGAVSGAQAQAQARAQAGHSDASPHGGEVVEVGNHHVEFKADSTGSITVWLLDENEKTVAPPAGASVTLIPTTGDQVTLPLRVDAAAQRLVARFDVRKLPAFQAVVSLTIGGKRQNVRFRFPHR